MHFDSIFIYLVLIIFGLMSGSFAGASVWRLRARQLRQDKKSGEKINEREYSELKQLTETSITNDRSRCLHCSYQLKWYDLIPIISWVGLRGRCRKCRKSIGYLEPTIEIAVAAFFVISFTFWPQLISSPVEIIAFILWLVAGVLLAILFTYDLKWFLLPDMVNFSFIGLGAINSILVLVNSKDIGESLINIAVSIMILSGIYWLLYIISKGRWIGFGDIKLGLGLALFLADWKLAFLGLFIANLIGCLIVIPPMLLGKLKRDSQIQFGPLLILGFIIAKLAGDYLVSMYIISL
jgi:prepilin signal peptidase PulO-like enzyme (type II secretory pathway)